MGKIIQIIELAPDCAFNREENGLEGTVWEIKEIFPEGTKAVKLVPVNTYDSLLEFAMKETDPNEWYNKNGVWFIYIGMKYKILFH